MAQARKIKRRRQRGKGLDIQKWLGKTGIEYHVPGKGKGTEYQLPHG